MRRIFKAPRLQGPDFLRVVVQGLIARLGRGSEFGPYLASVRAGHKRKRNFITLLDRAKWGRGSDL